MVRSMSGDGEFIPFTAPIFTIEAPDNTRMYLVYSNESDYKEVEAEIALEALGKSDVEAPYMIKNEKSTLGCVVKRDKLLLMQDTGEDEPESKEEAKS